MGEKYFLFYVYVFDFRVYRHISSTDLECNAAFIHAGLTTRYRKESL